MSLSPQVALMKRPIDEISVSDAGGGDLRDSAMVVDNAAFESHLASCVRLTTSSSYTNKHGNCKGAVLHCCMSSQLQTDWDSFLCCRK